MNKEERELLLKDLCARLPYGIRIECGHSSTIMYDIRPDTGIINDMYSIDKVKPYLRLMSSMTEEEKVEYQKTMIIYQADYCPPEYFDNIKSYDWLNAHHIDYRGLIEKGLALEAPSDMYNN